MSKHSNVSIWDFMYWYAQDWEITFVTDLLWPLGMVHHTKYHPTTLIRTLFGVSSVDHKIFGDLANLVVLKLVGIRNKKKEKHATSIHMPWRRKLKDDLLCCRLHQLPFNNLFRSSTWFSHPASFTLTVNQQRLSLF